MGERSAAVWAIRQILSGLSPIARREVLRQIETGIETPRAGCALAFITDWMPREGIWSVAQAQVAIDEAGVEATPKEVYNAVGYLCRRGRIKRLGYGRYARLPLTESADG